MTVTTRIQDIADTRRRHRTDAQERRRLAAELAEYRSGADRLELQSVLERHPDEVAEPIRRLVHAA